MILQRCECMSDGEGAMHDIGHSISGGGCLITIVTNATAAIMVRFQANHLTATNENRFRRPSLHSVPRLLYAVWWYYPNLTRIESHQPVNECHSIL